LCGEMHYFRIPKGLWFDRLLKLKRAGFNCVNIYFAWNYHEVEPGVFDVSGEKNFAEFVKLAKDLGLYVVARVGPYICSEWDNGGHPDWLISGSLVPRSLDPSYFPYAERWLRFVLSQLSGMTVRKGGNVAAVQLENEYFWGDVPYHMELARIAREVGIDVDLYTNENRFARNTVFIDALDLYPDPWDVGSVVSRFKDLLATQPGRPLKIMEYEGGWFSRIDRPLPTARGSFPPNWTKMLLTLAAAYGADLVSVYMFHGGTNFGYWTGRWITTTYDYEASVREWGELWDRYYRVKLVAPVFYLVAGSRMVSEEWASEGRLKVVRERSDGARFIFYVNNTDSAWVDGGVKVHPRDVKVVVEGLPLGSARILRSSAAILNVVGEYALFYDEADEEFEVEVSGTEPLQCYRAEALKAGGNTVIRGRVPENDVAGCTLQSKEGLVRVIVVPRRFAERTWFEGGLFAVSDVYFVRELTPDRIVAEVRDGEGVIYVPLRLGKGVYIEELGLSKITVSAEVKKPKVEIISVSMGEAKTEVKLRLAKLRPLEELGIYRHDYYVYRATLDEDSDIYVRANDHAVIVNNGEVIASGFISVSAKARRGELLVITESTGHPNDGLVPTFTGLLSPILLGRELEADFEATEFGLVDLSYRYQPGVPTANSLSILLNREVRELVGRASWFKELPELRNWFGVIYAKSVVKISRRPTVLKLDVQAPIPWEHIVVLVNGVEVYRGPDREIYVDPEYLRDGDNEIVVGLAVFNREGKPKISVRGKAVQFRRTVEPVQIEVIGKESQSRMPVNTPIRVDKPSVIYVEFKLHKEPDTVAPIYLELRGRVNAQIYLNGVFVGRYYGDGSQSRFYLPEPYLKEVNEVKLVVVPLESSAVIDRIAVEPYFAAKVVEVDLQ